MNIKDVGLALFWIILTLSLKFCLTLNKPGKASLLYMWGLDIRKNNYLKEIYKDMVQLNMVLSLAVIITVKRAIWNTVYPMKNYLPTKNIYYIKCGYNLYHKYM